MPDYRRYRVPGGSYFFTLVTYERARWLCTPLARQILREKINECRQDWPFHIDAIVLLPDHLHAIWTLPPGDDRYSLRWGWIKKEFTSEWLKSGGTERQVSAAKKRRRRRGIWQVRFWEHTIDDDIDFERHFDYIHYNPLKHGYVKCPRDWPHSTFHQWVKKGVYPPDWGRMSGGLLDFHDLDETAME